MILGTYQISCCRRRKNNSQACLTFPVTFPPDADNKRYCADLATRKYLTDIKHLKGPWKQLCSLRGEGHMVSEANPSHIKLIFLKPNSHSFFFNLFQLNETCLDHLVYEYPILPSVFNNIWLMPNDLKDGDTSGEHGKPPRPASNTTSITPSAPL